MIHPTKTIQERSFKAVESL